MVDNGLENGITFPVDGEIDERILSYESNVAVVWHFFCNADN